MQPIYLTAFRSVKTPAPAAREEFASWPELCQDLKLALKNEAPEKEGLMLLGPYRLREGGQRCKEDVEAITLGVLDVDHGSSISAVFTRLTDPDLEGFGAAIYTSPSDGLEAGADDRFRVLLPLSREIKPGECAHVRCVIAEILGLKRGCGVEQTLAVAQGFFIGRIRGTPAREWWSQDGQPWDVDALVARPLAQPWGGAQATRRAVRQPDPSYRASEEQIAQAAAVAESLPPSIAGHGGDAALFAAACRIAREVGEDTDAVLGILRDVFNPRCAPEWSDAKLVYEAERATSRQASPEARAIRRMQARSVAASTPSRMFAPANLEELVLDLKKSGEPKCTHANGVRMLAHVFGDRLYWDELRGRVHVEGVSPEVGHFPDGDWTDQHTTSFVMMCEDSNMPLSQAIAHASVLKYAREKGRNLLREQFLSFAEQWDGKRRLEGAMATYWGTEDTPLSRAAGRLFLTSLAARALHPGCKQDLCMVMTGAQGTKKSTSFAVLAGQEWFADSPLAIGEKEGLQDTRGWLIRELAENVSLSRKDAATVKAFLSSSKDVYRASYGRMTETVPRLTCYVATSNDYEVLNDPTGARRFIPIQAATVRAIDIDALRRDREQLLGEAAARVLRGEQHWPTDAEVLALRPAQEAASAGEVDPWDELIETWIAKQPAKKPVLSLGILGEIGGAIQIPAARIGSRDYRRLAQCMRRLGYEPRQFSFDGSRQRGWIRTNT